VGHAAIPAFYMLRRILFVSLCALILLTQSVHSAEQRARLELRVDEKRFASIEVSFRGDDILARLVDLDRTGIRPAGGQVETIHSEQYVSLKSLASQVSFQLNQADLVLQLLIKPNAATPGALGNRENPLPPVAQTAAPIERRLSSQTDLPARLGVQWNGVKRGEISVILRDHDIFAPLKDIAAIDPFLINGRHEIIRGETYVSLESLSSEMSFSVDERSLGLILAARSHHSDGKVAAVPVPTVPSPAPAEKIVEVRQDAAGDQRAILTLKVNEVKQGETDIILRGNDVLARVKDLKAIGMVSINGRRETLRGEEYVSLSSLQPALSFGVNEKTLALDLTIAPDAFGEHVIAGASNRPAKLEYPENNSGFLNYAVNLRDFKSIDAFSELGVTLNNTHLYTGISRTADGSIVRGLSNVTVSNRQSANRFIIGDRLVNSDILGGSITMGGLSYFRDFALDPYMVRNPGLHYEGAVSTPSTLDVYSNGQLVRRVPLPPGQFQVNDLPVPSGSNNTRYVIRDAFGRERELGSANFYFSSGLLTPGLHDFGYNIGTRRDDIGGKNWGYDMPLFLGHHRYGFTEYLTGGMRFEAAKGLVSGGPSVSFLLPIGETELVGAASTDHGKTGGGGIRRL
jgi:outer membrane usher protein FimD/PapC